MLLIAASKRRLQDHRIINSGFHLKEFIRDLWTTIGRRQVWHGEIKNRAKDGSFDWVDIVPFLNEQGKPRQYLAIRADITERKRAEEAIRELNAELEQRVIHRHGGGVWGDAKPECGATFYFTLGQDDTK